MGKFAKRHNGKIVGSDSSDRPGWKGPGYVKKAEPKPKKEVVREEPERPVHVLPVELQQLLLSHFKDAFPDRIDSLETKETLQEVKQALYERDFLRAFGKEVYLEVYSMRWSPSRALCYASILVEIRQHLEGILDHGVAQAQAGSVFTAYSSAPVLPVVAFGGGAAEVIAFGGLIRYLLDAANSSSHKSQTTQEPDEVADKLDNLSVSTETSTKTDLLLIDSAQWGEVVGKLHSGLTSLPSMSKYASAAAKEANKSMLRDGDVRARFQCKDVLELSQPQLQELIGQYPLLITLLFTMNELYTKSIPKATAFLLKMTAVVKAGTLLLVVDSPGSYSETSLGKEAKKYPMHFLLDHTLIGSSKAKAVDEVSPKPTWEKLVSEDSQWFRKPKELKYPIDLEDMRYQMHLYRRL